MRDTSLLALLTHNSRPVATCSFQPVHYTKATRVKARGWCTVVCSVLPWILSGGACGCIARERPSGSGWALSCAARGTSLCGARVAAHKRLARSPPHNRVYCHFDSVLKDYTLVNPTLNKTCPPICFLAFHFNSLISNTSMHYEIFHSNPTLLVPFILGYTFYCD